MVTKVGMQTDFADALKDLLELDYDAIEAYAVAVDKLTDVKCKEKLANFKADHERHTREITAILMAHNQAAPDGPSAKQWLTKGKVLMSNLLGDNAILLAMKTNEDDTNSAYERMNERDDIWEDAIETLANGLSDEKRHRAWIETVLA
jgi:hypothetical protein